jgi:hypothetical protein
MSSLIFLALLALLAWFWLDSLRAREIAIGIGHESCRQHGVQLLDGTVALSKLRLQRNPQGRLRWLRTYQFDFSVTGEGRQRGTLILLGMELQRLVIGQDIIL